MKKEVSPLFSRCKGRFIFREMEGRTLIYCSLMTCHFNSMKMWISPNKMGIDQVVVMLGGMIL